MLKQNTVIIEAIYKLGKLVNPNLEMDEVTRVLTVNDETETFIFSGKGLLEGDALQEQPNVLIAEREEGLSVRDCHIDSDYKFSEDGRVYDVFSGGYLPVESENNQNSVQLTLNRTVINMPVEFVQYYATTSGKGRADKLLEDALVSIKNKTYKEESKRKEEAVQLRLHKQREAQSERYLFHTKTKGLRLSHTPYILTEEGRVYDIELGRLRAVNNKGYTTNLRKGFVVPKNLSIDAVKNILENKDFTVLIDKLGYSEKTCELMWEDYQNRLDTEESEGLEDKKNTQNSTEDSLDKIAEKEGFIRTEDGYFIHKSHA